MSYRSIAENVFKELTATRALADSCTARSQVETLDTILTRLMAWSTLLYRRGTVL